MRRAVTLIELLVALLLAPIVIGMVFLVFQYQHRAWVHRADESESVLAMQGILHEFGRTLRSTGSYLPNSFGGLVVYQADPSHLKLAVNPSGVRRSALTTAFNRTSNRNITVRLDTISGFREGGYAILNVNFPARGEHQCCPAPQRPQPYPLLILRISTISAQKSTITLDLDSLCNWGRWTWDGAVQVTAGTVVVPLDTIEYGQTRDTLWRRISRSPKGELCDQLDSLRFEYLQPSGWNSRLDTNLNPTRTILAIRTRVWVHGRNQDPNGRNGADGRTHSTANAEFSLRNATNLANQVRP